MYYNIRIIEPRKNRILSHDAYKYLYFISLVVLRSNIINVVRTQYYILRRIIILLYYYYYCRKPKAYGISPM